MCSAEWSIPLFWERLILVLSCACLCHVEFICCKLTDILKSSLCPLGNQGILALLTVLASLQHTCAPPSSWLACISHLYCPAASSVQGVSIPWWSALGKLPRSGLRGDASGLSTADVRVTWWSKHPSFPANLRYSPQRLKSKMNFFSPYLSFRKLVVEMNYVVYYLRLNSKPAVRTRGATASPDKKIV